MADRLKLSLEAREMTAAELIRQTGLSRAGVYFLLDGTTKAEKVRATTVAKLCKALGVNRDWLLTGRGPRHSAGGRVAEETASYQSQPARLNPDTVRATHELLRGSYADFGKEFDIEAEPDLFATVYERLSTLAASPTTADLVSIGRVIEGRQQGANDAGRERAGNTDPRTRKKRSAG